MQHSFSFQELNGRSVEYQTKEMGTFYGELRPIQKEDGSFEIRIFPRVAGLTHAPAAKTLDPNHLLKHPFPARAEYLLAEDAEYIIRTIRADINE